jgi:hypothetical protein
MMTLRTRAGLRILLIAAFAAITLGINFLHTESGPGSGDDCPACHFLSSSLSTNPGLGIVLPALVLQETLAPIEPLRSSEVVVLSRCSRAPPSA